MLEAILVLTVGCLVGQAPGGEARPDRTEIAEILPTQVTVRLGKKQFQATVVGRRDERLTIVTAAHCIAPRNVGEAVWVSRPGRLPAPGREASGFPARVRAAVQNPDYRPIVSRNPRSQAVRGVLCVDNAVAVLEVGPRDEAESGVLDALRVAELAAASPVLPDGTLQTMVVHVRDQLGVEHTFKAGSHLNPKCLAWGGASYRPVPGDSGAGVFLLRPVASGAGAQAVPVLIGNVALSDDRGGIAPLLSRRNPWVERALADQAAPDAATR